MPGFPELLSTVTARVTYEEDFAFPKRKEELALGLRSDRLPKIRQLWGDADTSISFDDDGDIFIRSLKRSVVITRDALILTAFLVPMASVVEGRNYQEFSGVLKELLEARAPLRALENEVRLFVRLRFKEPPPAQVLTQYFQPLALSFSLSGSFDGLRWSTRYRDTNPDQGESRIRWEVQAEPQEFRIYYSWAADAGQPNSFNEFLLRAPLRAAGSQIESVVQPLIANPHNLREPAFLPPA